MCVDRLSCSSDSEKGSAVSLDGPAASCQDQCHELGHELPSSCALRVRRALTTSGRCTISSAMPDKDLHAKKKTRSSHEGDMGQVAAAVRRVFAARGLVEGTFAPGWTIDDAFGVLGGKQIDGRLALFFEAAVNVWTEFNSVYGARERAIAVLAELGPSVIAVRDELASQPTRTYLENTSKWGRVLGLQDERPTASSVALKSHAEQVEEHIGALHTHVEALKAGLIERRPTGVAFGFYGPKGRGPWAHFAYELHVRGFSDREIAILRGDVSFASKPKTPEQDDELRRAAEAVRQEIARAKKAIHPTSKKN
jgi:hypothetical protein